MKPHKKIVIIGPESTGKSTLCQQLADHYQTVWVKEYAREYLLQHGMEYSFEDLLTIAQGQIRLEEAGLDTLSSKFQTPKSKLSFSPQTVKIPNQSVHQSPISNLLFLDTDMYVMKVWCEFVFGKCHDWIKEQITVRQYDLYLLCNTDLPWVKDELREYPDLVIRDKLYHIYENILQNQPVPFAVVSGTHTERLQSAIDAVEHFCGH